MTKSELAKAIADKANLTIKDSEKFLNAFIEATTEALKKCDDVNLIGFCSFSVVQRPARLGRDFQTKKAIQIPASKGIRFKAGKNLREAVK